CGWRPVQVRRQRRQGSGEDLARASVRGLSGRGATPRLPLGARLEHALEPSPRPGAEVPLV
ncbi:MAG TPA: hypothetical protein VGI06_05600, partial [Acidimicrobiales bacterium]